MQKNSIGLLSCYLRHALSHGKVETLMCVHISEAMPHYITHYNFSRISVLLETGYGYICYCFSKF